VLHKKNFRNQGADTVAKYSNIFKNWCIQPTAYFSAVLKEQPDKK